jgi:hypothetical protein
MKANTFQSTLRMWQVSGENRIVDQGVEILKIIAAFGGIIFTAAFLITALRLAFAYRGRERSSVLKHMAFTGVAAFIHYSAWQIAPRISRIFFYPLEGLTVTDRAVYVLRWIASLGGFIFTLSFMCLGIYVALVGVRPDQRSRFYSGMVSTLLASFLFYTAWMLAPIIASGGLDPSVVYDKPVTILKWVGSMGGVLFTFSFLFLTLYLNWGAVVPNRRNAAYMGMVMSLIGAFIFYTAWQFAPVIADVLLPPECENKPIC